MKHSIEDLDIFEVKNSGNEIPYPCISVFETCVYINVKCRERLHNDYDRWTLSRDRKSGNFFIAFFNSNMQQIRGYTLAGHNGSHAALGVIKKFNITEAHYKIFLDECIFHSGFDWFPIEVHNDSTKTLY